MTPNSKTTKTSFATRFLILCFVFLAACGGGSEDQPTKYKIDFSTLEPSSDLSEEEQEVERLFIDHLKNNPDQSVKKYRERYNNTVNTDLARELSIHYQPDDNINNIDIPARTKWGKAVVNPSRKLALEVYKQMLQERPLVVFTAGGTSSGKTTSVNDEDEIKHIFESAQIIFDTTLSHEQSSIDLIELALKADKDVHIIYVYRNPVIAFNSSLERAKRIGRPVPLDAFIKSHINAPQVLIYLVNEYQTEERVNFSFLNNSFTEGQAKKLKLPKLIQLLDIYDEENLKNSLLKELETAREAGESGETHGISQDLYEAIKRSF